MEMLWSMRRCRTEGDERRRTRRNIFVHEHQKTKTQFIYWFNFLFWITWIHISVHLQCDVFYCSRVCECVYVCDLRNWCRPFFINDLVMRMWTETERKRKWPIVRKTCKCSIHFSGEDFLFFPFFFSFVSVCVVIKVSRRSQHNTRRDYETDGALEWQRRKPYFIIWHFAQLRAITLVGGSVQWVHW